MNEMESLSAVTYALAVFFIDNRRRIKAHFKHKRHNRSLESKASLFKKDDAMPIEISLPAPEYLEELVEFLSGPFR